MKLSKIYSIFDKLLVSRAKNICKIPVKQYLVVFFMLTFVAASFVTILSSSTEDVLHYTRIH